MASYELKCGVQVVFLYDEPFNKSDQTGTETEDHLRVLEEFASAWNRNLPDSSGKNPSVSASQAWPASTLVVSSLHHKSNHSTREPMHITIYVCGTVGWGMVPRRSNACVHIYSRNHRIDSGYHSFWIKNSNSNSFKSAVVCEKLQRALANSRERPAGC